MAWFEDTIIGRRIFMCLIFFGMWFSIGIVAIWRGQIDPAVLSNVFDEMTGLVALIVAFYVGKGHIDEARKP